MVQLSKATLAAIAIGAFGIFLIWQGITGNVAKTMDRKPILPAWVYVLSGLIILILPAAFLILSLQIK